MEFTCDISEVIDAKAEEQFDISPLLHFYPRKRWPVESVVKVRFLDGTPKEQADFIKAAETWESYANIFLQFGSFAKADIRVTFNHPRSTNSSEIGTDALHTTNQNQFTLGITTKTHQVYLHELGHALGFHHEHEHPKANIPWDKNAVYKGQYAKYKWDRKRVDRNFFRKHGRGVHYSTYDPKSIMHYAFPKEYTTTKKEFPENKVLSAIDKKFAAYTYPTPRTRVAQVNTPVSVKQEPGFTEEIEFHLAQKDEVSFAEMLDHGLEAELYGPNNDALLIGVVHTEQSSYMLDPGIYYLKLSPVEPESEAEVQFNLSTPTSSVAATKEITISGREHVRFRVKKSDKVVIRASSDLDDQAQITFGDPEPNAVVYRRLKPGESYDIGPNLNELKNVILLSIANNGRNLWGGTISVDVNGKNKYKFSGSGNDGWRAGFHTLARMVIVATP